MWFKVDDSFWSHPKVIALPDSAVALWTLAGAWAAQQLTDGYVPRRMIRELRSRPQAAERLVEAGLWTREEDGYRFHDWTKYQPTRAMVEARRAKVAERVARHRKGREKAPEAPAPKRPRARRGLASVTPLQTGPGEAV